LRSILTHGKEDKNMRIQLEIPDGTAARLRSLMGEVGLKTYSDIFGNALTGLDWMVKERRLGRIIVSTDSEFTKFKELSMPILDAIPVALTTSRQPSSLPNPHPVSVGVAKEDT
jgi:hypothetical protein